MFRNVVLEMSCAPFYRQPLAAPESSLPRPHLTASAAATSTMAANIWLDPAVQYSQTEHFHKATDLTLLQTFPFYLYL